MALILSAVMICSLAACGGKEDTQKQEAEAKEYTYVAEYMDVAGKEGESATFLILPSRIHCVTSANSFTFSDLRCLWP